jgi:hypothetical protein
MTQFNLADELRRGGTGLLAQAVASLWKMRFRDQPYATRENEGEYARAWLYARQQEAAAVPAGNQVKAPTALDEMRALQEGAQLPSNPVEPETTRGQLQRGLDDVAKVVGRPALLVGEHADAVRRALTESREALARVEAERDELKRVAEELGDVIRCSSPLAWDWRHGRRWRMGKMALSALDQAASEAEVTAEPTERIEYSKGRVAARRCLESAGAEVTERAIVVGSVWEHAYHRMRAVVTQLTGHDNSSAHIQWEDGERRVWPDWQLRAHFTWVSDPEATEIVGAPTERCKCGCRRDTHNAPRHHHLQADASLPLCGCIGFEPVTESAPREG